MNVRDEILEEDLYSFRKLYEQMHKVFEGTLDNDKPNRNLYLLKEETLASTIPGKYNKTSKGSPSRKVTTTSTLK